MSNKMTASNMAVRIAALPDMAATELKALWQSLYAKEPPPFNKTYFVKRLAYRIQELEYGVDSRPLERQLEAHARQQMDMQGKPKRKSKRQTRDAPISGTRLMREYQGEEHVVTVLPHGFDYRGQRFKSLSRIARTITGKQWSGPVFFGLRSGGGLK